jgi:DNA-directed RNA polymerase subunit beta'
VHHKIVNRDEKKGSFDENFEDRIFSHSLALDVKGKKGEVIIPSGTVITTDVIAQLTEHKIDEVAIRSVLTCETEGGVCKKCYGLDLGLNQDIETGSPV